VGKMRAVRLICGVWVKWVRKKVKKSVKKCKKMQKNVKKCQKMQEMVRKCEKVRFFAHFFSAYLCVRFEPFAQLSRTTDCNQKYEIRISKSPSTSSGRARQIQINKMRNSKRTVENGTTFQCHLAQNGRDFFRR